jgi:hypothetical protein
MKCEVCRADPATDSGIALFRQNPKGVTGIWRCQRHNEAPVAQEVGEITAMILDANRESRYRECGHLKGSTRWCPDCALAEDAAADKWRR